MKPMSPATLLAALAFAIAPLPLWAQDDGGADAAEAPRAAAPAFADLDTDADGFLSAEDIPAEHALSLRFAVADTDRDERLSQAEYDAARSTPAEEDADP